MLDGISRRRFLGEACRLTAAAATVAGVEAAAAERAVAGAMPTIRLGRVTVSRLILGSNPFFGFAHGNPQASAEQMRAYYSDERIMAVMDRAAAHGITAVWTPPYERWVRLWNAYMKGGKLVTWIAQPDGARRKQGVSVREQVERDITLAATNGAKAVCVQGCRVDEQFRAGRLDVLRKWLDLIHRFGLPAGLATHKPHTHPACEQKGLPADFYHQCLFQPENYAPELREKALAAVARIEKPVVVYKVLAAGRLDPTNAFRYTMNRLRPKDGLCVGVYPPAGDGMIAEDVALTRTFSG